MGIKKLKRMDNPMSVDGCSPEVSEAISDLDSKILDLYDKQCEIIDALEKPDTSLEDMPLEPEPAVHKDKYMTCKMCGHLVGPIEPAVQEEICGQRWKDRLPNGAYGATMLCQNIKPCPAHKPTAQDTLILGMAEEDLKKGDTVYFKEGKFYKTNPDAVQEHCVCIKTKSYYDGKHSICCVCHKPIKPTQEDWPIELLAEYSHKAWSGWMHYLFSKCIDYMPGRIQASDDGALIIPKWAVDRWKCQAKTEYDDLSQIEKNSDRDEAKEIIKVIKKCRG